MRSNQKPTLTAATALGMMRLEFHGALSPTRKGLSSQESNIDRLLKARAELDEELRRHKTAITLLFTDVVGSTAYFDRYGDTAGMAMLHRHAELAANVTAEFRGTVIKTIGDSVMAEFPEPAFAVRAAVEIERRLMRLNQSLPERERLQLRIGINHGSGFRRGSDVYGDAVNVAARITKRTGPAQILISRSVRDAIALDPELRCTWLGKITLEGRTDKEDVFEVIWTDTATYADLRGRVTAALARGELASPGLGLEDLIEPERVPSPLPDENATIGLVSTPAPTELAARYDILAEVGRGGMGIIYRARDRETGEVVALKVLQPEIAARPDLIERFKSELLLARKITHKNVCRVHDLNRFGSVVAISMEYIEGESLRGLLNRVEGLSVRHGLKILNQVLAGLAEAHAQGVIHRDLKPENILIAREGTVKLMDFGIARSLESGATSTGTLIGTPAYMSPEQAQGKPVDARSDIYSLGLVMYEMFVGQPAFRADTPVALAMKQAHETPPPPGQVDPHLPRFLDRAIQKCLEKEPKKRFQSVAELETALREEPAPVVVSEGEPVPASRLVSWQRADIVLLVLGLVGFLYFLAFRDHVFPASQMRLEVDAITARRTAEELAARLGNPFAEWTHAEAQLDFRRDAYVSPAVVWALGDVGAIPLETRRRFWSELGSYWPGEPLVWRVKFRGPDVRGPSLGRERGNAVVDRRGKVERLSRDAWIPGNYKPPPIEQRRAQAQQAVESVCGPIPADYMLTETSGGEQNAAYSATWNPRVGRRLPRWTLFSVFQVSLLAEKLAELRCGREEDWPVAFPSVGRPLWFIGTVIGILLVALFILSRGYRSPWLWRRLPLALVLGLIGEWLVHAALGWPDVPLAVYLLEIFAGAGFALIALVTAEDHLRRRVPGKIASYVLAWRGRFGEPAVALAIVRGALAGLALVAFETLLAHLTRIGGERMAIGRVGIRVLTSALVDPEPMAQAIGTFSPALYVVSAALLDAVLIALVFLGLMRALLFRKFLRAEGSFLKTVAAVVVLILPWFFSGFRLHVAAFVFPLGGAIWARLFEALLLAWLLERYDVLTVMVAVATAVIWIINYPLLVMLQEVGNASHWAVFIAWGAIVLLAAILAFRASLGQARRRLLAAFE